MQGGASTMVHTLLDQTIRWARQHRVQIDPAAWKQAVEAVGRAPRGVSLLSLHQVFRDLLMGIEQPTVILWGTHFAQQP